VVVGHLDAYFAERDRHLIYIDSSLAVTPFMMACETLGLGTCAINWPDMEDRERAMAERIGLSQWERPIMLLAIGYADPKMVVPKSVKKPVSEIVEWIPKRKS
jgi:nitroreductase